MSKPVIIILGLVSFNTEMLLLISFTLMSFCNPFQEESHVSLERLLKKATYTKPVFPPIPIFALTSLRTYLRHQFSTICHPTEILKLNSLPFLQGLLQDWKLNLLTV
jgi:hypothetical protein